MKLVKMRHADDGKLADVHPDEVENYRAGGFSVVEEAPVEEAPAEAEPRKRRRSR